MVHKFKWWSGSPVEITTAHLNWCYEVGLLLNYVLIWLTELKSGDYSLKFLQNYILFSSVFVTVNWPPSFIDYFSGQLSKWLVDWLGLNGQFVEFMINCLRLLHQFIINSSIIKVFLGHNQRKCFAHFVLYLANQFSHHHHHHLSLNHECRGAPQMISKPVFSIFPCSPLPSGTCQTPGLSIPWCCLPTSSSVYLVFFPLSLCLTRWFWPDLMNRRHDHTIAVCISLWWSRGLCVVQLPAGSWHGLPRFMMVKRSLCGPIACWILAWTSSLVTWSLYEMCNILQLHLISMACILLWSSAVKVHDSQAYRKMDVTR